MMPDDFTIQETFLPVSGGHELYVQEWGNPKARVPIIFLHGGPGSGCKDKYKQSFDPLENHVVFFDQRGAGRSLPYGSLAHNTTQDLIGDITAIADHFGFKTFVLWGGSWGSTLALAYAVANPKRVHAVVAQGIWTASHAEIEWIGKGGFKMFFPEAWERYLAATPKAHHSDPTAYHMKRALGDDPEAMRASAYAYSMLESGIYTLDDRFTPEDPLTFDPTSIRLEMYYTSNNCFMPDRHIFNSAHLLTMPVWMVQGRYDMVCPPVAAYELDKKLPNSHLIWTLNNHRAERESHSVLRALAAQFGTKG